MVVQNSSLQVPNISIAFLVREIRPLVGGSRIRNIQELPNNWLKVTLSKDKKSRQLIIASEAIFLTGYSLPAKHQSSGFGAFLKKRLVGKTVDSIEQHEFDRVVVLRIGGHFLVVELFAKGNVILLDSNYKIVAAYRVEHWKDRELKKNVCYRFPASKGLNPKTASEKGLIDFFADSKDSAIGAFLKKLNVAPVIGEEIFFVSRVEKAKPASKLTKQEIERLCVNTRKIYSITTLSPVVVFGGKHSIILPFPLKSKKQRQSADSINSFLDEYFSQRFAIAPLEPVSSQSQSRINALKKSLERQLEELSRLEARIVENREKGERIFENYGGISQVLEKTKKGVMYKGNILLKKIDKKNKKIVVEIP